MAEEDAALVESIVMQVPELVEKTNEPRLERGASAQDQSSSGAPVGGPLATDTSTRPSHQRPGEELVGRPLATGTSTRPPVRTSYAAAAKPVSEVSVRVSDSVANLLPNLGRIPRPNTVVLHTQAFRDITDKEVLTGIFKCVAMEGVKTLQRVPGPSFRLTFRNSEAKEQFLSHELSLRDQRVTVQELEKKTLVLKLYNVPDEISNATVSEAMSQFGTVVTVTRSMHPNSSIEDGIRVASLTSVKQNIPHRVRIGPFPVEIRYRGQLPQCNRCGEIGHRVATCLNEVKCFRCGQSGHVRRQCFRCFLCGQFGHFRVGCPQNADRRERDERLAATVNPPVNNEAEKSTTTEPNPRESPSTTRIPEPPPIRIVTPANHLPALNVTSSNRFALLTKTANIPRIDDMDESDDSEEESSDTHDSDPLRDGVGGDGDGDDDDDDDDKINEDKGNGGGKSSKEPGDDDAAAGGRTMHHMIVDPSQSQRIPPSTADTPRQTESMDIPTDPLKRPRDPTTTSRVSAPDSEGFQTVLRRPKKTKLNT